MFYLKAQLKIKDRELQELSDSTQEKMANQRGEFCYNHLVSTTVHNNLWYIDTIFICQINP